MEEIIKEYGFDSLIEFHSMVANVDLSTPEKIKKFKDWQNNDGSKVGLINLPSL